MSNVELEKQQKPNRNEILVNKRAIDWCYGMGMHHYLTSIHFECPFVPNECLNPQLLEKNIEKVKMKKKKEKRIRRQQQQQTSNQVSLAQNEKLWKSYLRWVDDERFSHSNLSICSSEPMELWNVKWKDGKTHKNVCTYEFSRELKTLPIKIAKEWNCSPLLVSLSVVVVFQSVRIHEYDWFFALIPAKNK